jgi:hypothetical protein|tara:strand:+ start:1964 stop:2200 length:237 start_codon:yes stop_codon:yes gene_type:complete
MGDLTFLGYKRINSDTDVDGNFVVSGSITSTGAIKEGTTSLVSFSALEKMVVTEETTNIMNFELITDSTGDVVVHAAL